MGVGGTGTGRAKGKRSPPFGWQQIIGASQMWVSPIFSAILYVVLLKSHFNMRCYQPQNQGGMHTIRSRLYYGYSYFSIGLRHQMQLAVSGKIFELFNMFNFCLTEKLAILEWLLHGCKIIRMRYWNLRNKFWKITNGKKWEMWTFFTWSELTLKKKLYLRLTQSIF